MIKSEYTKQQETAEEKIPKGAPKQRAYNPLAKVGPLPQSNSEEEPEDVAPGNVVNTTWFEKGQNEEEVLNPEIFADYSA